LNALLKQTNPAVSLHCVEAVRQIALSKPLQLLIVVVYAAEMEAVALVQASVEICIAMLVKVKTVLLAHKTVASAPSQSTHVKT
jgi:hypothetical protein